jgi:MerR family transcriptional regulator/heat shock protein HspR
MKLVRVYYQSDYDYVPISELCIHPNMLNMLSELGVLDIEEDHIEIRSLRRLNKIMRLQDFLGVNLKGAIIITDLLERIESLEDQIRQLEDSR